MEDDETLMRAVMSDVEEREAEGRTTKGLVQGGRGKERCRVRIQAPQAKSNCVQT